jgi:hypothetical protein
MLNNAITLDDLRVPQRTGRRGSVVTVWGNTAFESITSGGFALDGLMVMLIT